MTIDELFAALSDPSQRASAFRELREQVQGRHAVQLR